MIAAMFAPPDLICHVFTFKRGALSALGHDLKLQATRCSLTLAPGAPHATFDPSALRVICAMHGGEPRPGTLSDGDRQTIERHLIDDVLHPARHPRVDWRGERIEAIDARTWRAHGRLSLHGQQRPLIARIEDRGDRLCTRIRLQQTAFGIRPFRALLGALKIADEIEIALSVPGHARAMLPQGCP